MITGTLATVLLILLVIGCLSLFDGSPESSARMAQEAMREALMRRTEQPPRPGPAILVVALAFVVLFAAAVVAWLAAVLWWGFR
jgi:fatty acid desaturase